MTSLHAGPRRGFQCYGTHPANFLLSGRTRVRMEATTLSKQECTHNFHWTNDHLCSNVDIAAHNRHTWKKSFTYRTGTLQVQQGSLRFLDSTIALWVDRILTLIHFLLQPVRCVAFSPNGRFLAASSATSGLWVWQYKEKESPLLRQVPRNNSASQSYLLRISTSY